MSRVSTITKTSVKDAIRNLNQRNITATPTKIFQTLGNKGSIPHIKKLMIEAEVELTRDISNVMPEPISQMAADLWNEMANELVEKEKIMSQIFEDKLNELKEALSTERDKTGKLETQNNALQKNFDKLSINLENQQNALTSYQEDHRARLIAAEEKHDNAISSLEKSNDELKSLLDKKNNALIQLERDLHTQINTIKDDNKSELSQLSSEYSDNISIITKEKIALEKEYKDKIRELENDNTQLNAKIGTLETGKADMSEKHHLLTKQNHDAQNLISELNHANNKLEHELERLKDKISRVEAENKELQLLTALPSQINVLEEKNKALLQTISLKEELLAERSARIIEMSSARG